MRREPDACVRAKIAADGVVALRRGTGRVVATIGASVGLIATAACVHSNDTKVSGVIEGRVVANYGDGATKVTATDTAGRRYTGKVRSNGRYRISRLPAGTYSVSFQPGCCDEWTLVTPIEVGGQAALAPDSPSKGGCIVVGKLETRENVG